MISLSPATPDDVPAIAELGAEMRAFYGAAETGSTEEQQEQVDGALFGEPPTAWALLAWDGAHLAGFAAYSFVWPAAGLTESLYLKDLFVRPDARRSGVGAKLMQGLFDIAVRAECSRVEWTADTDNPGALAFYEALGAAPLPTKVFYRVEGDDLLRASQAAAGLDAPKRKTLPGSPLFDVMIRPWATCARPERLLRVRSPATETCRLRGSGRILLGRSSREAALRMAAPSWVKLVRIRLAVGPSGVLGEREPAVVDRSEGDLDVAAVLEPQREDGIHSAKEGERLDLVVVDQLALCVPACRGRRDHN
jgi:GNAT superfamily N-acetyltransferase